MKHFDPDRIREVRIKSGMTQAAVEKAVGVGPHYLSRIERGGKPCGLDLAQKIAKVCGVEMWTLYAAIPRDAVVTPPEREVLRRLRALSGDDQARVLGYIDALGVSGEPARRPAPGEISVVVHEIKKRGTARRGGRAS